MQQPAVGQDPLVHMKLKEQWFWCEDFKGRTNRTICQDRIAKKRPYSPCSSCSRWRGKPAYH
jgi:hypothetical protein